MAEGGNIERLPEGVLSLTAKRRAESALRSAEICTEAGGAREKIQGVKWLVLFHSTTERERTGGRVKEIDKIGKGGVDEGGGAVGRIGRWTASWIEA